MTHSELVKHCQKWLQKNHSVGIVASELKTSAIEIPDVIGFGSGRSVLIECKVSREDFRLDAFKPFRGSPSLGVGKIRYYAAPEGMLFPHEMPDGWGLLSVNAKGKVRVIVNSSENFESNLQTENLMLYSIARRLQKNGGKL